MKKIYMSFVMHANMNYDRYTKSHIRKWFPKIYKYDLEYLCKNPNMKGQIEFSGMTLKTLYQTAPEVITLAKRLEKQGQIGFTGTYYCDPVNMCVDGETDLANAKLGRLRLCIPPWNTRPVLRKTSASARLSAMFFVQGFSQ